MELPEKNTLLYRLEGEEDPGPMLEEAAALLKEGGLVAFPTETVYGLGASAYNSASLERVFRAKGRPPDNPLIVHLPRQELLEEVAREIPPEAFALARRFWPGPLTLVLKRKEGISPLVSCGLPTVAVRVPSHPLALKLLERAGVPVAAPSANLSGRPSPTRARHVMEDLSGKIDAVVDGGSCKVGVESSVLDLCSSPPVLLRPGGVSRESLEDCTGKKIEEGTGRGSTAPASPGVKYKHYAPRAPLYLFAGPLERIEEEMERFLAGEELREKRVGLLCSRENRVDPRGAVMERLGSRHAPERIAGNLYAALRNLDQAGVEVILAEGYPERGMGLTVMNRLKKASREIISVE